MSVRSDIAIDWSASPRIIEVAAPSVLLKCQDLHDTLRSLAALPEAMDEDEIVDSSGKEALGAGLAVGLTIKLLNAKVRFQARTGPDTVQCLVYDGTLVTADGSTPIAPSLYTSVAVMNQVGGVIATSSADVEAIAAAVHDHIIEGGLSFKMITRILMAVGVGLTIIDPGPPIVVKFRDLYNSKDRVMAEMSGFKRVGMTLDGT